MEPGQKLGPYEIVASIGAGGMGEVYRARDTRLGRDVAVKVLPGSLAGDADRLRRFEQEARAAGALNHPNVTAVYDVGVHDGAPYLVEELLEGETLRAALAGGRLPFRKAVDDAIQMAKGLGAAHDRGIVHRDLKPENVFVTRDGRVKILDFGLAKLQPREAEEGRDGTALPTESRGTDPGTVMGTLGYMSPEQVRGQAADARSDVFALGAILYEMLSGLRAFRGDSAADTISAILREEPPDLSATNRNVPPELDRIVRHCLEKSPEQRFQAARDVAFALEALSNVSAPSAAFVPARGRRRAPLGVAAALLLAALSFGAGRFAAKRPPATRTFHQLSFRPEPIMSARFSPDGKSVVYSSVPEGSGPLLNVARADYPGAAPPGRPGIHLLAVSSRGELAVLTKPRFPRHDFFVGTLARMPLEGGAPREIAEKVREADWTPDGSDLAVIRSVAGKDRLEFPLGKVLAETSGYFSWPRFSPRGDRIAFFDHPVRWDDRGDVAVVDLAGRRTTLSTGYWGLEGLAWNGDELLFSGGTAYNNFKIFGVRPGGKPRVALESAGGITIHDVHPDGRWLTTRDDIVSELRVLPPGEKAERELSWLDFSLAPKLSADGKTLLFDEESGSVGELYAVCLRGTDGSPVVRLGEGSPFSLSADGKWVAAAILSAPPRLVLYPTGAGSVRTLERGRVAAYDGASFFPDGRRLLVSGAEAGRAERCWVQPLDGGAPSPVTPEGAGGCQVSPDGRSIAVRVEGGLAVYPAAGGEPRPVPGTTMEDFLVQWSADGKALFVTHMTDVPIVVVRADLESGERRAVRTIAPPDMRGVLRHTGVSLSEDGTSYAYSVLRTTSHLFLVDPPR